MLHVPTSRNGEIWITIYDTPYSNTYNAPYGNTYGTPYGNTYGTPYGNTYGTPYGNTYGTPYGNTYGTPYDNTYGTPYGNTYSTAIAHLPQLHYTYSSSAKNCDIYVIIIIYTFLALLLFILHNGTTCLYIPLFCTEITLRNLHLSCCSIHTCHLLQGATC